VSATTNLIFAGVGGQGVLLMAELTARAAVQAGFDVKQTEVHGVSQRGGSVESHLRYGPQVHSPLVMAGTADVVVGLEKLEALRFAGFLQAGRGRLLVNDHEIIPGSVANAAERYPHQALDFLRAQGVTVLALPASQRARELGDGRMANVLMLGALAGLLALPAEAWQAVLETGLAAKQRDANLRAFEAGREWISVQA
jgi:indolepyruvate ferredoxin oxidoreductase beta subunit